MVEVDTTRRKESSNGHAPGIPEALEQPRPLRSGGRDRGRPRSRQLRHRERRERQRHDLDADGDELGAGGTAGANGGAPWGHQRSDETLLTGDALAKVTAIAKAKVAGGTIIRVETDADGVAAYEAHMTKADGSPVTVYVDKDFNFVSVQ